MGAKQKKQEDDYGTAVAKVNEIVAKVLTYTTSVAKLKAKYDEQLRQSGGKEADPLVIAAKKDYDDENKKLKDEDVKLKNHVQAEHYFKQARTDFYGQRAAYNDQGFLVTASTEPRELPYQRGVRLGDVIKGACRPTYMAITVLPKPTFKIGAEKLSLEVGAYYWDEYEDVDLNTPARDPATAPPDQRYVDTQNSGLYLKVVSSVSVAAIAALSLM